MENETLYGLICLFMALVLIRRMLHKSPYKYPLGPKGRRFFGSLFDVSSTQAHFDYTALCRQYGDVMTVRMLHRRVVILSSSEAIRDAFVSEETRDAFAGRPRNFFVKYCDKGPSTAFMMNDDLWKSQRKFLSQTLKVFDGGKHAMEKVITAQLEESVKKIRSTQGKPFEMKSYIIPTLANILAILILGKRFEFDSPEVRAILEFEKANSMLLSGHVILILTIFPFLRHVPGRFRDLYRAYHRGFDRYLHFFYEIPKAAFDPNAEPRGYLDTLFKFQSENPWYSEDKVKGILKETVTAGMATTRGASMSFFLVILHKPEVMKNIQREIDSCIGRDRLPTIADRSRMPYTEAATMEILRYVTVVPLGLPHSTSEDVGFRNYFLPKDTVVFANQWAVHHDEEVWGDPWEYRPERFLDNEGKLLPVESKERKNWLAFGVGRRSCLAETFARTRLFLMITTLLQRFDFRPCADEQLPSCDPRELEVGVTMQDPKYKMCAFERNSLCGSQ